MIRSKPCQVCGCMIGLEQMHERIRQFSNGSFHIEGTCMMCESFMAFIPYAESRLIKRLIEDTFTGVKEESGNE